MRFLLLITLTLLITSCGEANNQMAASSQNTPTTTSTPSPSATASTTATPKPQTAPSPTAKEVVDNKTQELQTTKGSYTKDSIHIAFPQITNLGNEEKQNQSNALIKSEALKVLNDYPDETDGLSLDINYTITFKSTHLLSIQYSGIGTVKGALHPNNLFYTTTVNLDTSKKVTLSDLVKIDANLVEKVRHGRPVRPETKDSLTPYTNDDLLNRLANGDSLDHLDSDKHSDTFSYLTGDSLGISLTVSHAAGDHAEYEVKVSDLADNLKTGNEVWSNYPR